MHAANKPLMSSGSRQVYLHRDESGWWIAEVPSLPGCASPGRSQAEAVRNVKEAIAAYVASLEKDGEPVPDDPFDADLLTV